MRPGLIVFVGGGVVIEIERSRKLVDLVETARVVDEESGCTESVATVKRLVGNHDVAGESWWQVRQQTLG